MAANLEDYALIGDRETAALVARDGSIDWLCWPRFDSGACFAALLGGPEHGRWLIAPQQPNVRVARRYRSGTLVLETEFETESGRATLIDFMTLHPSDGSHLFRLIEGQRGRMAFANEFRARFDYGSALPWMRRLEDGTVVAVVGPDMLALRSSVDLEGRDPVIANFEIAAGETVT